MCSTGDVSLGPAQAGVLGRVDGGEQTLAMVTGGRGRVFLLRIGQADPGVLLALEKESWSGDG